MCPKCGSEAGWTGPTYKSDVWSTVGYGLIRKECLSFICVTCGYQRTEPTKDAPPSPPPPPDPSQNPNWPPGKIEIRDGDLPPRPTRSGWRRLLPWSVDR